MAESSYRRSLLVVSPGLWLKCSQNHRCYRRSRRSVADAPRSPVARWNSPSTATTPRDQTKLPPESMGTITKVMGDNVSKTSDVTAGAAVTAGDIPLKSCDLCISINRELPESLSQSEINLQTVHIRASTFMACPGMVNNFWAI